MKRSLSRSSTIESKRPSPLKRMKIAKKKATTLQATDGKLQPFPRSKVVNLIYENSLNAGSFSGAATGALSVKPNSAYDFDNGTSFGNKQPLYYDALFSASGPYKNYKVDSWTTTYTVVNMADVPVTIFALPPISATGEIDSLAEADNFPGVKRLYLTAKTGSKSHGTVTVTGNVRDVYTSASTDLGFVGAYNTDPAYLVYQGLFFSSADGTTALNCYVAVRHVMHTTCQVVDAIAS